MGEVVDLVPRTPGTRRHQCSAAETLGVRVMPDGSMVLLVLDAFGDAHSFIIAPLLVAPFETAVSVAARHSREITGR